MDIKNCKKCGRIFNYVAGAHYCPSCRTKIEEEFQAVKRYIYSNPQSSIIEISESCEVPIKQIHQWVREERLVFPEESAIGIECERCGTTIKTGRYCDDCKNEIQHGFGHSSKPSSEAEEKKKKDTQARMRFLSRDNL